MTLHRMSAMAGVLALAGALAACGGGGSSSGDLGSSTANSNGGTGSSSSTASTSSSTSGSGSSSSATSSSQAAALGTVVPANGETAAYVDTTLQITFDSTPSVGSGGYVYVYNKTSGALVDKLSLNVFSTGSWVVDATAATPALTATLLSTNNSAAAYPLNNTEVDRLGGNVTTVQSSGVELYRWVFRPTISIAGNVATIKLHDGKLSAGTSYYVTMDSGVLNGTINGVAFGGISSASAWAFKTKADPSSLTDVTVAASGTSADFRTVQGALNWLMQNCSGTATNTCNSSSTLKTVTIADGTYDGLMWVRGLKDFTISGTSRDGTILQAENFEQYNVGTGAAVTQTNLVGSSYLGASKSEIGGTRAYLGGGRSVLLAESVDLMKLTKMTLKNTHVKSSSYNNQAETIYFNSGSGRLTATYMNFLSAQDTVQVKGYSWFYNDLVAGDVDFIWGAPYASVFENSEIRTVVDPTNSTSGGYVVQSRAYYGYPGFVFLNSTLTSASGVPAGSTYLARSGGNYCTNDGKTSTTTAYLVGTSLYCDVVSYINTTMGTHVASAGWYTSPTPNLPVVANTSGTGTTAASYLQEGSTGVYAAQGWFEYGSKDASGNAISSHGTDGAYSQQMDSTYYTSSYSTRAQIFQSYSAYTGWAPTETACATAACVTSQ